MSRRLLPDGEDPDPRMTLANERTFLAWIRTALAFLAGGIALEAFAVDVFPSPIRTWLAIAVVCIGLLIAAGAAFHWLRIERAMRIGGPLPLPAIVPLLGAGATVASFITIVLFLVE
nr:DUF202 domain-containing protein [Brevibacterium daeguense]